MPVQGDKRVTRFITEVIVDDESPAQQAPRILAVVPTQRHGTRSGSSEQNSQEPRRKAFDPLRETLPWPLPESYTNQLSNLSIRETEPWTK